MKQLILASGSAGRKQVLEQIGVPFLVDVSNYEEDMTLDMKPRELAIHLSKGKASDVAARHQNAVILGADSFAVYNGQLLGKPKTTERAKEVLSMLSGHSHSFVTGFTVVDADSGNSYSEAVETKIYFRKLTPADIAAYIAKENVLDRAGAYVIQGVGALLIEKIEGNYTNILGLPIPHVAEALKKFGIDLLS